MSTITKERVAGIASGEKCYTHDDVVELARIALASLEAEPVCVIDQSNLDYLKSGADADVWPASRTEMGDVLLYRTAPPAPANAEPVAWLWSHRKHPSEVTLVRPEDDEMAEVSGWSGWSCQALYSAPPAPVSVPDALADDIDSDDHPLLWSYNNGWNACRAAMLQGAENAESRCTIQTAPVLDSLLKKAESRCSNSPIALDGWVMVPVEPTEDMIVNGFESEPDESFSDEKEWKAYDAMIGCQQAAHRAKLCWAAMIAAAPKQEVKP